MKQIWRTFTGFGMKGSTNTAFILLILFIPCHLRAQNDSLYLKNHFSRHDTLHEVEIRGLRVPASNTSLTPVQKLKGPQLEKLGSLSVADALRYFSGAQIKDYGGVGGLKTVNVRSLGSNHTAVFYDGIQLGNAQNGQIDLGKFSLDNIEEIDLYNAQKSGIFQSARAFSAASALYLQSKIPVFNKGETDHVKAAFRAGSFGLINPSLLWQHKVGDNVSSLFSTEWQRANGRYKFRYTNSVYDTTAKRQNGDIDALRIEAGLHGTLRDSSKWSLKAYSYLSERGLPRAIVSNNFESGDRQKDNNAFIQAAWQSAPRRPYELMLSAKYASDNMEYLRPDFDNIEGKLDNHFRQKEYYFSAAGVYHPAPSWDIALSSDFQINTLNSTIEYFSYPTRYTSLIALAGSFHAEKISIQGNVLATLINETVKEYTAPASKKELTPAFTASWQPFGSNQFLLRAFYKSIFRMPTFNDLYYTFTGNVSLRPERARLYDAGFTYQSTLSAGVLQNITIQTDAYYNRIKDKIVAVPGENIASWMMMNLGRADIKGLETTVTAAARLSSVVLSTALSYTFQRALDLTNKTDYNYRQQIPYTPEHSGSLVLGAQWKDLGINYSYIYAGERYSQKANIAANYMQPWYTHDISASQEFRKRNISYKIMGEVNNLLNQYRDIVLNFPMPGRSYRLVLSGKF